MRRALLVVSLLALCEALAIGYLRGELQANRAALKEARVEVEALDKRMGYIRNHMDDLAEAQAEFQAEWRRRWQNRDNDRDKWLAAPTSCPKGTGKGGGRPKGSR